MMSEASVTILNVGHGNSAVIKDRLNIVVVDTGGKHAGGHLLDYLRGNDIPVIHALILSHADEDHIGSAATLLLAEDFTVEQVFLNTDSTKTTSAFRGLLVALGEARRNKGTTVITSLTMSQSEQIPSELVNFEVLFPSPENSLSGPGGTSAEGEPQNTNSLSAVIRLSVEGGGSVILPGDCDMAAIQCWEQEEINVESNVVVFPHHGGRPGTDNPSDFAKKFSAITNPSFVIFSMQSNKFILPREDIVEAILDELSDVNLACTQLPERLHSQAHDPPWQLHCTGGCLIKEMHICVDLQPLKITVVENGRS